MGNNVLIVGPPHTGKVSIAQLVTKDFDSSSISNETHSGLVYQHTITTKYFTANINILVEEYPNSRKKTLAPGEILHYLQTFSTEFAKDEFKDLRDELDGIVFTIDLDQFKDMDLNLALQQFENVKNLFQDQDLFYAVVGNCPNHSSEALEEIEDEIIQFGFEFLDISKLGINEFKERIGKDRLLELFESHDWAALDVVPSVNLHADNVSEMTESLLEREPIAFDKLLDKIKAERERAKNFNPEEKERLVKEFVRDIMDNF